MAVYTTTPRTPINWDSPAQDNNDYFLLIDDTYFLDIGNGFKLKIQGSREATPWNTQSRTPLNF